jgi:hypothetical protein
MISNKLVKEVHGLELQWKVGCLSRTYSAVVLADKKEGISVKPYWKDKKERQEFISEWQVLTGKTKKETVEMIEAPTFCFAHIKLEQKVANVRNSIKNGGFEKGFKSSSNPICPFA